MKWLRKNGTVIAALAGVVIAGSSLGVAISTQCWTRDKYDEITKPHTQFDEVRDKLIMLDKRLDERETWIESSESDGEDRAQDRGRLDDARRSQSAAEAAWIDGDFDKAERLIKDAYDASEEIEPYILLAPTRVYWWAIMGVAAAIVTAAFVLVLHRRRRV